ncbi:MAG: hypothetical protein V3U75_14050 [Methylococcaceae bacterium]
MEHNEAVGKREDCYRNDDGADRSEMASDNQNHHYTASNFDGLNSHIYMEPAYKQRLHHSHDNNTLRTLTISQPIKRANIYNFS